MRTTLALALTLLGITLLLNRADTLFPRPHQTRGADAALDVIVAAKGPLLPSGLLGAGPERIGEAIRIGERTLTREEGTSGLRVATLGPGLVFEGQRTFDVAAAVADARAFAEHVGSLEPGSLLLVGSSGWIEPSGAERAEIQDELAAALEELGARARPFGLGGAPAHERTSESWALIAARLAGGWVPLAEAYSTESGVVLAFSVSYDLERYEDFRGELVEVRASDVTEVFLEEELPNAARRDPGVALVFDQTVGARPMRSILQTPLGGGDGPAGRASRVAWDGVKIGKGSGLRALVGLADGAREASDGVTFEVRVDGTLVHTQRCGPADSWRLLQVDLRPFAGRSVDLELAVDPGADPSGDWALWGRPMLVHGLEGPPAGVQAGERR